LFLTETYPATGSVCRFLLNGEDPEVGLGMVGSVSDDRVQARRLTRGLAASIYTNGEMDSLDQNENPRHNAKGPANVACARLKRTSKRTLKL
jgi:hypothetical protein